MTSKYSKRENVEDAATKKRRIVETRTKARKKRLKVEIR